MLQMKVCGDPILRTICTPVEKIDDALLHNSDLQTAYLQVRLKQWQQKVSADLTEC